MSEVEAEDTPELKITKEQAIEAFNKLGQAIDQAVRREFPVGMDALDEQMILKGALMILKMIVIEYCNETEPKAEEPEPKAGELVLPERDPTDAEVEQLSAYLWKTRRQAVLKPEVEQLALEAKSN